MTISRSLRFAAIPALFFCGAFAAVPAAQADDAVLATVNGNEIRESDLALAETEVGAEVANIPPENRRRLLLEFLIEMQMFSDAAEADKLTEGPDFERRLAYWKTRAQRDAYYEKAVKDAVGEQTARALYEQKVKEIPQEEEVQARHILVEGEELAKSLAEKARSGEDFSKLAEENSKDPGSKGNGGMLGYFTKGQMVEEFSDAAFALKEGDVSDPVKSQYGWHVIKVEDRRMKPLPTFDEVKGQISQALEQQKGQEVSKALRDKTDITYVDAEIRAQVEKEVEAQAAQQRALEQQMQEQLKKIEDQKRLENEAK